MILGPIYGTPEEWVELKQWCAKNKPKALLYLHDKGDEKGRLATFTSEIEAYIRRQKNCPAWLKARIEEKYTK